jgi:hypothetical protein
MLQVPRQRLVCLERYGQGLGRAIGYAASSCLLCLGAGLVMTMFEALFQSSFIILAYLSGWLRHAHVLRSQCLSSCTHMFASSTPVVTVDILSRGFGRNTTAVHLPQLAETSAHDQQLTYIGYPTPRLEAHYHL